MGKDRRCSNKNLRNIRWYLRGRNQVPQQPELMVHGLFNLFHGHAESTPPFTSTSLLIKRWEKVGFDWALSHVWFESPCRQLFGGSEPVVLRIRIRNTTEVLTRFPNWQLYVKLDISPCSHSCSLCIEWSREGDNVRVTLTPYTSIYALGYTSPISTNQDWIKLHEPYTRVVTDLEYKISWTKS